MREFLRQAAYWVREYFGENDYPRYLAAWQVNHAAHALDDAAHRPLNARDFYAQRVEVRFGGAVQRC